MDAPTADRLGVPDALAGLDSAGQLDISVFQEFHSDKAAQLLASVDLLITSWGCPRIDAAVLDRAPELGAIIHIGGSVKVHLDAECWNRGIRVSSVVDENAIPGRRICGLDDPAGQQESAVDRRPRRGSMGRGDLGCGASVAVR